MTYEVEGTTSIEIEVPFPHRIPFNEIENNNLRKCEHEFLEEMKDASRVNLTIYQ